MIVNPAGQRNAITQALMANVNPTPRMPVGSMPMNQARPVPAPVGTGAPPSAGAPSPLGAAPGGAPSPAMPSPGAAMPGAGMPGAMMPGAATPYAPGPLTQPLQQPLMQQPGAQLMPPGTQPRTF